MTYRKTFQGAHEFTDIKDGYLFTRAYFFMSKREALTRFKSELRGE